MSVTSGFFNSVNGDRRYNAEQFSAIFDGIIRDGVFASVGTAFGVSSAAGNKVTVNTGRAWFDHIWIHNDAVLVVDLGEASAIYDRYDAVVIEVNKEETVRSADVKVVTGTAATNPAKPTLKTYGTVKQYPIAYIRRKAGATSVSASDIEYVVGSSACPLVTGILEVISNEVVLAQWRGEFDEWFGNLRSLLSSNDEAAILGQILDLRQYHPYWTYAPLPVRRSTFRGNNLGSSVTPAQLSYIQQGLFTDMWVGDYWEIGGIKWRIVDFDYWYKVGDTVDSECTKHHVVIMPDTGVGQSPMSTLSYTTGGYVSSMLYNDLRSNNNLIPTTILGSFGDMLVMHRDYFSNEVTDGHASNGGWYDSTIDLPNEIMIYGTFIHTPSNAASTTGKTQLALFRVAHEYIKSDGSYWLRDVVSGTHFANVQGTGLAAYSSPNVSIGVRPVFAIG